MSSTSDLARYYAALVSEVSVRSGAVVSADLVAKVTGTNGTPREAMRLRGADAKLLLPGGIALAMPAASGTIARLEDIPEPSDSFSLTTDDVPEGVENLYYTDTRADARIAAAVGVSLQAYDADLTTLAAGGAGARSFLGLAIGADVQAHSSVLDATTASFTSAQETKLGYVTVTQAVDLDDIETRVNALDAAVVLKGTWDASAGSFPGGGTAQAGASYIVSVAGVVDSVAFAVGDRVIAILDNASTSTYASNWFKADYTDQVSSVAGRTGAVTLAANDISDATTIGKTILSAADAAAVRTALALVPGTDVQAYGANLAALSGLTSAADKLPYFTGAGTAALATFTAAGRALVDDADAAAQRTTLGLGALAVAAYPGAGIPNSTGSAWGTSYTTTGAGSVVALQTSPSFVTPSLGAATGTSLELGTIDAQNAAAPLRSSSTAVAAAFERNDSVNNLVAVADFFQSHASGTGANQTFAFKDSGGTRRVGARIGSRLSARAASTITAGLSFDTTDVGTTPTNRMNLDATALAPATAGGIALGTSSLGFGALYLDEAGAGTETLAVTSAALSGNGSCVLVPGTVATLAGTETLTNKTLTSPVISSGVTPNGDVSVDLGSTSFRWSSVHAAGYRMANNLYANNAGGNYNATSTYPLSFYLNGDKLVFSYYDAGTVRYLYIALTGSGTTWTHTTTAP